MKTLQTTITMVSLSLLTVTAAHASTLCRKDEVVVFSCSLGKKIVSYCGTTDASDNLSTIQYRFGTKHKVELQIPETPAEPSTFLETTIFNPMRNGAHFMQINVATKGREASYELWYTEGDRIEPGSAELSIYPNTGGKRERLTCATKSIRENLYLLNPFAK